MSDHPGNTHNQRDPGENEDADGGKNSDDAAAGPVTGDRRDAEPSEVHRPFDPSAPDAESPDPETD